MQIAPIVVHLDKDLWLDPSAHFTAMAVNHDATRLYMGKADRSTLDRLNLLVVSLDPNEPIGHQVQSEPRLYRDSPFALPLGETGTSSGIEAICLDELHHKLYLGLMMRGAGASEPATLIVYDLDQYGDPVGDPIAYTWGADPRAGFLQTIVRHPNPAVRKLYLGGEATFGPRMVELDSDGFPRVSSTDPVGRHQAVVTSLPGLNGRGTRSLAINEQGTRLYFGTSDAQNGEVVVYSLYPSTGDHIGTPRWLGKILNHPSHSVRTQLVYSLDALYFRKGEETGWVVGRWPLDSEGDPTATPTGVSWPAGITGAPIGLTTLPYPAYGESDPDRVFHPGIASIPQHRRVWIASPTRTADLFFPTNEVVDGSQLIDLMQNTPLGIPALAPNGPRFLRQQVRAIAVAGSGRPLVATRWIPEVRVNRQCDWRIAVRIVEARGPSSTPTEVNVRINLLLGGLDRIEWAALPIGVLSSYQSLDPFLKDEADPSNDKRRSDQIPLQMIVTRPPGITRLTAELSIDPQVPGDRPVMLREEVEGDWICFLVPGYGYDGVFSGTAPAPEPLAPDLNIKPLRYKAIETFSDHFKRYLEAARRADEEATLRYGRSEHDQARQLIISAFGVICNQADRGELAMALETLALLGFNTAQIERCKPLTAKETTPILDRFGFRSQVAVEISQQPPGSPPFDYFHFMRAPGAVQAWAAEFMERLPIDLENDPQRLALLILADEPGWYSKPRAEALQSPSTAPWFSRFRAAFTSFLQSSVATPAELGSAEWDRIEPLFERDLRAPLTDRRRFYWSVRFLNEQAISGMEEAQTALAPRLPATMNLNNASMWYAVHSKVDGHGMSFDWFSIGRRQNLTLFTEDWFPDQMAQNWSFYGDLLRTAAMGEAFGGYVVGLTLGQHPAGAAYKILALLGHGAKYVVIYTWGSSLTWGSNSWSDRLLIYPQVASALRLVGRADHLLAPGKRAPGKVALLRSGSSDLWAPTVEYNSVLHTEELRYLHFALTHAGYTCDIVDETELSGSDWRYRGYTTLYVTGGNVALAAQNQIRRWVEVDGGVLVAVPGAGLADEYDERTTIFDELLGLQGRERVFREWEAEPMDLRFDDHDPVLDELVGERIESGLTGISVHSYATSLVPDDPTDPHLMVLARFSKTGGPAIIRRAAGKGFAYAYGFPPGRAYWRTPKRHRAGLPRNWSAKARFAAVLPVIRAETPRQVVVSHEGVEACRIESAAGIAIILLNWTDMPTSNLAVTLPDGANHWHVTTASGKSVGLSYGTTGLQMTLDLNHVDILMLTSRC